LYYGGGHLPFLIHKKNEKFERDSPAVTIDVPLDSIKFLVSEKINSF